MIDIIFPLSLKTPTINPQILYIHVTSIKLLVTIPIISPIVTPKADPISLPQAYAIMIIKVSAVIFIRLTPNIETSPIPDTTKHINTAILINSSLVNKYPVLNSSKHLIP